jgi:hypothetical protein
MTGNSWMLYNDFWPYVEYLNGGSLSMQEECFTYWGKVCATIIFYTIS